MNTATGGDEYEGVTYEELCAEISDGYMGETGDLVREHARSVLEVRQLRSRVQAAERAAQHMCDELNVYRPRAEAAEATAAALGAAIQAVEELCAAAERSGYHSGGDLTVDAIRAALAPGVDRKDTEQPQAIGVLLDAEHRLRLLAERTGDYDAEGVAMRINSEADRLAAAATATCVVCHLTLTSDDPHGGLCCEHRYDEQPSCPLCRAGQVVPQQPTCEHGKCECHEIYDVTYGGIFLGTCLGPKL